MPRHDHTHGLGPYHGKDPDAKIKKGESLLQPAVEVEVDPTTPPDRNKNPKTMKHEKPIWEQYGYPDKESFLKRNPQLRPKKKRR